MRLLIDENVSGSVGRALAAAGNEVAYVAAIMASADDYVVLDYAVATNSVLVTFESDFGRMIFAEHRPSPRSVIYLRSPPPSPAETVQRIMRVLDADAPSIDGYFVSIDATSRYHPFPTESQSS